MSARLLLIASMLGAALSSAAPSPRVYVVSWAGGERSPEAHALVEQADRALRDELRRRGANVVDSAPAVGAIVLRPSLAVLPQALELKVVGLRSTDRALLGTISTRASGSTRSAQLRAVVQRACREAEELR
jgi:hypothetical protein